MIIKPDITSLRGKFQICAAGPASPPPLKTILLVGAETKADNTLSDADESYLWFALKKLAALQIPVAPDCAVEVVNRAPAFGGEDFLTGDYPADAIVVCSVPDIEEREDRSAHHFEPGIWAVSAKRSGAQFVIAFGDRQEVTGNHFARNGEFTFVTTGDEMAGYQVMRATGPTLEP